MAIPMNLLRSAGNGPKRTGGDEEIGNMAKSPTGADDSAAGSGESMSFKLLMKKGNKQTVRNLEIPIDVPLASNSMSKNNAEKEEQQELKRRVLQYEEREEEENQDQFGKCFGCYYSIVIC